MATARPVVSVYKTENPAEMTKTPVTLPHVFNAPLRADLVRYVHTGMNKNKRQATGVKYEAGYDTAAASWGTGRAVARIPRVPGGGTHRSGQGAFGNMCRGGGMFAPLKAWRRWHRKVNTTQKRHALSAAISATGVPALVMARGHKIGEVSEIPLVVDAKAESIEKTKDAIALLKAVGAGDELAKVNESKNLRAGRGKMRNRRYVMRKGPLVIYKSDEGISRAFRNIPGVDLCNVDRLNLLQLAPGGTFGRFVIWTEPAMKRLGELFGTYKGGSSLKKGYTLPRSIMTNTDIARIINSDEIQSALLPQKATPKVMRQKKNALTNKSVMGRLMPTMVKAKKIGKLAHVKGSIIAKVAAKKKAVTKTTAKKHNKASKQFMKDLLGAYSAKKTEEVVEEEE